MPTGAAPRVLRDVRIARPFGSLSAEVHLPAAPGRHPAVVTVLPYRRDLTGAGWAAHHAWFAERGYAGVLVELRGYGRSDGVAVPKMHPDEGDDAVAAVEWAAAQDWCTGVVGLWGASSGGVTTLRAAARRPPSLAAIIPMVCPIDPLDDAFHHDGARTDLHQRVMWSGMMLLQQLLPPLGEHTGADEQRWRDRLSHEPFLRDFAELGPGDPRGAERAVDVEAITAPALCVGGWHDLYAASVCRLYERLAGPKELLVGPWFHDGPPDVRALALAWWERWLHGGRDDAGNRVRAYRLGERPGWLSYERWPPPAERTVWSTEAPAAARRLAVDGGPDAAAYRPDAGVGTRAGLWGIPNRGFGLPLDQRPDEARSVTLGSAALETDVVVAGEPVVRVEAHADRPLPRLVVRLAAAEPGGHSHLVTTGVLARPAGPGPYDVRLRPVVYRVPRGWTLRVSIGDADFPRLTPLPAPVPFTVGSVALDLPVGSAAADASGPPLAGDRPPPDGAGWEITEQPLTNAVTVRLTESGGPTTSRLTASVPRRRPDAAVVTGRHTASVADADARVDVRCTQDRLSAHATLTVRGETVVDRRWDFPVAREEA